MDAARNSPNKFVSRSASVVTGRDASGIVSKVVKDFRRRGHKIDRAFELAGEALGLAPSYARSIAYGKVFSVPGDKFCLIRRRYAAHLHDEARVAREHLAQIVAEIEGGGV